jgi:hypothetical protein
MPFSPVVDNYLFKKQPYQMLLDGEYDNSVNIITGSTQHETEIFVRAIFPEPMSGAGYKIALRALIQDANKVDQVMALYPANCHDSQEEFTQKISVEECKEKICGSGNIINNIIFLNNLKYEKCFLPIFILLYPFPTKLRLKNVNYLYSVCSNPINVFFVIVLVIALSKLSN